MTTMIFVNLPVKDLAASRAFYEAIGFTNNPQFTDETAACMVVSDTIFVMLLTHPKFAEFTDRQIADAHKVHEVLTARLALFQSILVEFERLDPGCKVEATGLGHALGAVETVAHDRKLAGEDHDHRHCRIDTRGFVELGALALGVANDVRALLGGVVHRIVCPCLRLRPRGPAFRPFWR